MPSAIAVAAAVAAASTRHRVVVHWGFQGEQGCSCKLTGCTSAAAVILLAAMAVYLQAATDAAHDANAVHAYVHKPADMLPLDNKFQGGQLCCGSACVMALSQNAVQAHIEIMTSTRKP